MALAQQDRDCASLWAEASGGVVDDVRGLLNGGAGHRWVSIWFSEAAVWRRLSATVRGCE